MAPHLALPRQIVSIHAAVLRPAYLVCVWTLQADGTWKQARPLVAPTYTGATAFKPAGAVPVVVPPTWALEAWTVA